jgi:hypothetical protein
VIHLRVSPATVEAVHRQLNAVLAAYSEQDLHEAFVVVEVDRHRFRRAARR